MVQLVNKIVSFARHLRQMVIPINQASVSNFYPFDKPCLYQGSRAQRKLLTDYGRSKGSLHEYR